MTENWPEHGPAEPVLQLTGFGVGFGERVVLGGVDLTVRGPGTTIVVGPSGSGKSTLLRTLSGALEANPNLRRWGEARYLGRPLDTAVAAPALVAQHARLLMATVVENIACALPERGSLSPLALRARCMALLERAGLGPHMPQPHARVVDLPLVVQRHIGIVRQLAAEPALLCIDEPTSGLTEADADRMLAFIERESVDHCLLVVLHNQRQAHRLGGHIALLAGGYVQEQGATQDFLTAPQSRAGQVFVRTGSCAVASPDCEAEALSPDIEPPPPLPAEARQAVSAACGPRGFLWLVPGQLAGTPRPGVVHELEHDLKALQRMGVTTLITLTEAPLEAAVLADFAIDNEWFPMPDMQPPTAEQAEALCRTIDTRLARGEVVAVHCHAGLGRTGTVLAAWLIWHGATALAALEQARRIEPRWVQAEAQVDFLQVFFDALRGEAARRASLAVETPH